MTTVLRDPVGTGHSPSAMVQLEQTTAAEILAFDEAVNKQNPHLILHGFMSLMFMPSDINAKV